LIHWGTALYMIIVAAFLLRKKRHGFILD